MPLMTSDEQVTALFGKYLEPGESELIYAYGQDGPPMWLQMLIIGALLSFFMSKYYFVGLTDRRLLLIRISSNYNEKSTEAYALNSITGVSAKKAWLGRMLQFTTPDGQRHRILLRNKLLGLRQQKEYTAQICDRLPQRAGAA